MQLSFKQRQELPLNSTAHRLTSSSKSGRIPNVSAAIVFVAFLGLISGLVGCTSSSAGSSGSGSGGGGSTTGQATYIYADSEPNGVGIGPDSIVRFSATATGSVSPQTTNVLPGTDIVLAIATDSSQNLYAAVQNGSGSNTVYQVLVYSLASSGSSPTRTITLNSSPDCLTVDAAGNLYVGVSSGLSAGYISVYSSTASGSATPTRTISLSSSGIEVPEDVAVDSSGQIYVVGYTTSNLRNLFVYASTATGQAAPVRTITNSTNAFDSVAVLPNGNVAVATAPYSGSGSISIMEFGSTATGAATPANTITGGSAANAAVGNLRADQAGDLYLSVQVQTGNSPTTVYGYSANATGTATPFASFTSSATVNNDGLLALQ